MKKLFKLLFFVSLFMLVGTINTKAYFTDFKAVYSPTKIAEEDVKPEFDNNINDVYYFNNEGKLFDSEFKAVESLPESLIARDLEDSFSGIGVVMTINENGNVVFVDTIENTPAADIIKPNDIVISIDGEDVSNKGLEYVATKIRGEVGTDVTLDIIRNGENLSLTIKRQIIKCYGYTEYIANSNISLDSIDLTGDNVFDATFSVTNNVGNTAEKKITVYVDREAPTFYVGEEKITNLDVPYVINVSAKDLENNDFELPLVSAVDFDLITNDYTELSSDSIVMNDNFDISTLEAREEPYVLTYTATDSVENSSTLTVNIFVSTDEDEITVEEENTNVTEEQSESNQNTQAEETQEQNPQQQESNELETTQEQQENNEVETNQEEQE